MGYTFSKDLNAITHTDVEPIEVGELIIADTLHVLIYDKMPCKFHRFMVKLLLGWEYIEKDR